MRRHAPYLIACILAAGIVVGSGIYTYSHTDGATSSESSTSGTASPTAPQTTTTKESKEPNRFTVARLDPTQTAGFCGVLTTGQAYCWGMEVKASTPQLVQTYPVEQISVGFATCVLSRGEVFCRATYGDQPTKLEGVTGATAVATSLYTTCVLAAGNVYCIGNNTSGTVGDGTHYARTTPTRVIGVSGATALAVDFTTACAVAGGDLWCWGDNTFGQLGDGTKAQPPAHQADRSTPAKVAGLGRVTAVSIGGARTCAISDGDLFCWGRISWGLSLDSLTPTRLPAFGKVSAISVGEESVCAIREDGTVACGGENDYGQLGGDPNSSRLGEPVVVKGINDATAVAASNRATCAATAAATYCWGDNENGQLGDGTTTSHKSPSPVRWPS